MGHSIVVSPYCHVTLYTIWYYSPPGMGGISSGKDKKEAKNWQEHYYKGMCDNVIYNKYLAVRLILFTTSKCLQVTISAE